MLEKYFQKIFFSGGTCQKDTAGTSAQLSLAQLGGVFIVLVGGMVGIFMWIMKLGKIVAISILMLRMWLIEVGCLVLSGKSFHK